CTPRCARPEKARRAGRLHAPWKAAGESTTRTEPMSSLCSGKQQGTLREPQPISELQPCRPAGGLPPRKPCKLPGEDLLSRQCFRKRLKNPNSSCRCKWCSATH